MNKLAALLTVLCAAPLVAQTPPRTTIDGSADLRETVSCPDSLATRANYTRLCADANGRLHFLRDNGVIVEIGSGGGGGGSMSAAEILAELVTVDGTGSALDADTLDGLSSASFALAADVQAADILALLLTVDGPGTTLDADTLDGISSAAFALDSDIEAADILALLLTVDGAGTGVDADLLDGQSSAAFALANLSNVGAADILAKLVTVDGDGSDIDADTLDGVEGDGYALVDLSNVLVVDADTLDGIDSADFALLTDVEAADILSRLLTVDGPGSGVDADTLDGISSAAFALDTDVEASDILASLLTVDGAGSGLDCDTVDGISSGALGGGSSPWTKVTKAADEARTATTTFADDAELLFAMSANTVYNIRLVLYVAVGASATPDFKWQLAGPASPTAVTVICGRGSSTVSWSDSFAINTGYTGLNASPVDMGSGGVGGVTCDIRVHNGANAGNLTVQWAQSVSDAAATTVRAGSFIEYDAL